MWVRGFVILESIKLENFLGNNLHKFFEKAFQEGGGVVTCGRGCFHVRQPMKSKVDTLVLSCYWYKYYLRAVFTGAAKNLSQQHCSNLKIF